MVEKTRKFFLDLADIIAFLIFILGLFFFIKIFVIALVVVKGHSMLPTYNEGNIIFVDKIYWKYNGIERGDVVVVMPPTSEVSFLKRVIGLPGDLIEIKTGYVYLCKDDNSWKTYSGSDILDTRSYNDGKYRCKQLKEKYIRGKTVNLKGFPEKIITEATCNKDKFKLGSGQYLVFGDDRKYSTDSRCCFKGACIGDKDVFYITKDEILGRIWGFKK